MRRLVWFVAFCLFGILFSTSAIAAGVAKTSAHNLGSYHAILIGISGYEGFNKLKTPVKDVSELANVLKNQYGFDEVTQLTDKTKDKPTASNILRLIREQAQRLTDKDNLLIYYAGHGHVDELTSAGYWIPINGKLDDPSTWISHDQIKSILETNRINGKNIILIADSCYSGNLTRSIEIHKGLNEEAGIDNLLRRGAKKSREVITSGGNEPVEDNVVGSDHSLFAHYLLKALKDNQNRYTDFGTLLHENVTPEVSKRGKQVPQRSRVLSAVDENGVFVLTKIGIAEKPRKADMESEIARLNNENEKLVDELRKQSEKQKKYESELSTLYGKQNQLLSEKNKLDELDKKNKTDEIKLKEFLKEKDKLSADKIAELEREKNRIDQLNQQIVSERMSIKDKEKSLASAEAALQKNKLEIQEKAEAQKQSLALLEQKKVEIEAKENALKLRIKEEEERSVQAQKMVAEAQSAQKELERKVSEAKEAKEKLDKAAQIAQKEMEKNLAEAKHTKESLDREAQVTQKEIERNVAEAKKVKEKLDKEVQIAQKEMERKFAEAKEAKEKLDKEAQIVAGVISDYKRDGDAKGRFIVFGNIVFDKQTNLMWLKDANYANVGKNYESAEKVVDNLNVAGFSDWHIPTLDEWRTLIPKGAKGVGKAFPDGHPFENVIIVGNYWVASSITGTQGINLGNGSTMLWGKQKPGYVWPVRYSTPDEVIKIRTGASAPK